MPHHITKQVAFILSLGHSGSTLLGHCLGAHPRMLHIGEIPAVFAKGLPFRCHFCMESPCPIWGSVLDEATVRHAYEVYRRSSQSAGPLWSRFRRLLLRSQAGRLYLHIFDAFPETRVIIDGSKNLSWFQWQSQHRGFQSFFLLLVRDLRAVCASNLRREPMQADRMAQRLVNNLRPILAAYQRHPETQRAMIRYEDLATDPAATLTPLAARFSLAFDPAMLEFWKTPQHTLGGNRGPNILVRAFHGKDTETYMQPLHPADRQHYSNKPPGFHLDERWKNELTTEQLEKIEAVAGQLNRDLGYR